MNSDKKLIINTDGGARGNPGPSGIGVVIADSHGLVLETHKQFIGKATNNVAEYKALLVGLMRAKELGAEHVVVQMDSELIVRQMQGVYKIKDAGLKPLATEAKEYIASFQSVLFIHVRREMNKLADKLVNEAIDESLQQNPV